MLLALVAEVSVIRERMDTHERLAEDNRRATPQHVEDFDPTDSIRQERADWRENYVGRILRVHTDELERIARQQSNPDIDSIIEEVSRS